MYFKILLDVISKEIWLFNQQKQLISFKKNTFIPDCDGLKTNQLDYLPQTFRSKQFFYHQVSI